MQGFEDALERQNDDDDADILYVLQSFFKFTIKTLDR